MSTDDPQDLKEQMRRAAMPTNERLMLEWIKRLSERVTTNEADTERRMNFILEQQA
jgi:hypothetical protein